MLNREEVIRMAKEMGFLRYTSAKMPEEEVLVLFASLVAAAELEMIYQEEQRALRKLLEKDDYDLRRHLEQAANRDITSPPATAATSETGPAIDSETARTD